MLIIGGIISVILIIVVLVNSLREGIKETKEEERRKTAHAGIKAKREEEERHKRWAKEDSIKQEQIAAKQAKREEEEAARLKAQQQEEKRRKKERIQKVKTLTTQYEQHFKNLDNAHGEFIITGFSVKIFEKGSIHYSLTDQELQLRLSSIEQLGKISSIFPTPDQFLNLHSSILIHRKNAIENLKSCIQIGMKINHLTQGKFTLSSHLPYMNEYWFVDASRA